MLTFIGWIFASTWPGGGDDRGCGGKLQGGGADVDAMTPRDFGEARTFFDHASRQVLAEVIAVATTEKSTVQGSPDGDRDALARQSGNVSVNASS